MGKQWKILKEYLKCEEKRWKKWERVNNTKQSGSDMELLLRKVHTKQLKNNGKIAVSMCCNYYGIEVWKEYHGRNDYETVGIMRDIFGYAIYISIR